MPPDLVLAATRTIARAYADIVERVTGEAPLVIVSDDPKASSKIEAFATGDQRMAVWRKDDLRGRRHPTGRPAWPG